MRTVLTFVYALRITKAMDIDIKAIRGRLGLSQQELAERIGVNQASISRMESGRQPVKRPILILLSKLQEEAAA
jgi:transcriptional regulator with XRE-family HTH domain